MLDKPAPANQVQLHRPQCSKCGALTMLARIEPSNQADHDLRTFECTAGGNSDVVLVKFR